MSCAFPSLPFHHSLWEISTNYLLINIHIKSSARLLFFWSLKSYICEWEKPSWKWIPGDCMTDPFLIIIIRRHQIEKNWQQERKRMKWRTGDWIYILYFNNLLRSDVANTCLDTNELKRRSGKWTLTHLTKTSVPERWSTDIMKSSTTRSMWCNLSRNLIRRSRKESDSWIFQHSWHINVDTRDFSIKFALFICCYHPLHLDFTFVTFYSLFVVVISSAPPFLILIWSSFFWCVHNRKWKVYSGSKDQEEDVFVTERKKRMKRKERKKEKKATVLLSSKERKWMKTKWNYTLTFISSCIQTLDKEEEDSKVNSRSDKTLIWLSGRIRGERKGWIV